MVMMVFCESIGFYRYSYVWQFIARTKAKIWIIALLAVFISGSSKATEKLEQCILLSSELPLLGERNDTPLVRAKINGQVVAIFISPEISKLIIRNVSQDLWFPQGETLQLTTQDDRLLSAEKTAVDELRLGEFQIGPLPGYLVTSNFPKMVGKLPIIGIVGRNVLVQGLLLMIDIPHGFLAFFKWDHDRCGSVSGLLGSEAHTARLSSENSVAGTISGEKFDVHFDPDLVYNSFPMDSIGEINAKYSVVENLPKINVRYSDINVGHLTAPFPVTLNGESISNSQFLIQKRVSRVVLGSPFFKRHTVIFDFTHHELSYVEVPLSNGNNSPSLGLHFDMTYTPHTVIHESSGQVN